jgi:NAD(P)-dependent dehydrogenase (short-subunit alcohol dehydrogenase family)
MKLDGQVAIVVGSARGIGETIAHTLTRPCGAGARSIFW